MDKSELCRMTLTTLLT